MIRSSAQYKLRVYMGASDHKTETMDFANTTLAALFGSLDEGVIVWNKDGTLAYANPAARRITQLSLAPGSPLRPPNDSMSVRVIAPDSYDASAGTPMDALPVYRAFKGETVPREQIRFIGPDGAHRWLSVSAQPIYDSAGELLYVISSMRDVSLRKSRESKLEFMVESAKILSLNLDFEQRLIEKAKLTVPSLADWCSINILEGGMLRRITIIDERPDMIERLERYEATHPRDEMMNVITAQRPVFIKVMTDEIMQQTARSPEELRDLRELKIKSLIVIPIVSRGEGVGAMTLAYSQSGRTYDESDLEFFQEFCYHVSVIFDNARLFREIESRDHAKDLFLASLSHELRNPLAPIKSSLELIKMRNSDAAMREEIDIIEHQFDHMARLLNDLLDVSRFTQDRISLSTKPVDLRNLIERALRGSDALIRDADLTLHFAYPSGQMNVVADETRLEQAVSNLLSNAVKFTPAGGSIWVDLERSGNDAIIRVRDNGSGIDERDLPNIFDLYYQGVNKGLTSGLGIGLLLVQRIVSMHRGRVVAKSEGLGHGSEFVISLPLAEIAIPPQRSTMTPSLARNLRIMIVDDNAPAADALARLLNKLGADATAAYSGRDALGKEQLELIDLFLLDVGMPEMDGYALVRALRSRGISAPIVALTGYGLAEDKERAISAGFTAHLTKPVGLAELNQMLENVLTVST